MNSYNNIEHYIQLICNTTAKQQTVQQIIDNLCISTLEYRDESDPDVAPYVHNREVELIKVCMVICLYRITFCTEK